MTYCKTKEFYFSTKLLKQYKNTQSTHVAVVIIAF